jgi:hypothetical protein
MTRATLTLAFALLLALPGFARADVIHLSNGRTLEGKVVSTTPTHIRLRVAGGQFELPRHRVARVETRRPASEDYAERARKTDMDDPRQVKELADWASARNLGARARQLRGLARGLQLEKRIARAKAGHKASAYYDTYAWAKVQGFSPEIQRYLLDELLSRWPQHRPAQRALAALEEALRPKPTPAEEEQTALREKLARQAAEAAQLKKRVQELEESQRKAEEARQREAQARRRARRRRGRRARQRNGQPYFRPLFTLNRPERGE